jgi:divalent metal cation (Fe/Co/Zn/Cd) transporter
MLHPAPMHEPFWNYVVLGFAAVFEGASFTVALRQFLREKGDTPFWRALRVSKDPTTYTVLAEDSAALAGLAAAAVGIYASQRFDLPVLDGAASVVIGVILAGVAILLIREARGLLIGEGILPETAAAVREIACRDPQVRQVGQPLSMYIGADEVLLTLDVQFASEAKAGDIVSAVARIEREIRSRFPKIKRIYIEAGAVAGHG